MDYGRTLPHAVIPSSGPLPALRTLRDASRAITKCLPRERMRQPHWLRAGWAVHKAAAGDDPSPVLLHAATMALADALEAEGWAAPRDLARLRDAIGLVPSLRPRARGAFRFLNPESETHASSRRWIKWP